MIETEAMHATSFQKAIKKFSTLLFSLTIIGSAVSLRNACADALGDAHTAYQSRNYAVARDIWSKLAQNGDSGAQYRLGEMYDLGQGVTQNYAEALKWYQRAAAAGNAGAANKLGVMYDTGRGVRQSYDEAVKWYRMGAKVPSRSW